MLVCRRGLFAKVPNSEEGTTKSHPSNGRIANRNRAGLTECNTAGGPLGARNQSPVVRANGGYKDIDEITTAYGNLKAQTVNNGLISGSGSLASHEVIVSDSSDLDDNPHDETHDGPSSGASIIQTPNNTAEKLQRCQQQPNSGNGRGRHDEKLTSTHRRKTSGPAAALSSVAVAAARRRLKQGLPHSLTVVALPPTPQPPPPVPPQFPVVNTTELSGRNKEWRRRSRDPWSVGRTAAILAMVLLVTAAVAARLFLAARTSQRHGRRVVGAVANIGGSSPLSAPAGALPYMAGWARLLSEAARPATAVATAVPTAARASTRTSVITAAFPRFQGHTHSGSNTRNGGIVSLRLQQWYGSSKATVTPGAPRNGGGPSSFSMLPIKTSGVAAGGGPEGSKDMNGLDHDSSTASSALGSNTKAGLYPPQPYDYEWRESATVRVITVVHAGAPSPYRTTWDSLAEHTAQRFEWTDPSYQMMVFNAEQLGAESGVQQSFLGALEGGAQMVVGLDVTDAVAEAFLKDPRVKAKLPGVVLFVGGSETLTQDLTRLQGGLRPQDPGSWRTALARRLTWTPDGRGLEVWDTVQLLLSRYDSDNFLFVYLVLVNQYVTTVRQVADTTKGFDLQSLICMAKNCGPKVVGCVQDPTCKSALDCLQGCSFNDQVCQYRCIVSYESPLLEQFSLCILQLHNCRNLDAKPPLLPDPAPMTSFRGIPLNHGTAEELFFGWLDEPSQGAPASSVLGDRKGKPYSWLVAAGKNPAYDYFPCQHQLYYRGRGQGQVWYEPVFKVITLDGREVWRRRVYRVRRGKVPGTFHLSVLDNGVTSNEFWRILDCDEDLQFCLFYYSGAASAAGLSYSGAVLGTPDGRMPGPQHTERLNAALRRAGIEPWELSYVRNEDCSGANLRITGPVAAPAAAV